MASQSLQVDPDATQVLVVGINEPSGDILSQLQPTSAPRKGQPKLEDKLEVNSVRSQSSNNSRGKDDRHMVKPLKDTSKSKSRKQKLAAANLCNCIDCFL